MTTKLLPVALLALASSAVAQGGAFTYPTTGRLTIDRAYHYRAECKVGQVDVIAIDEYVANPAQREANVQATQSGGSAMTRWGVVPIVYLPWDPIGCPAGLLEVIANRQGTSRIKADNGNIRFSFGDASLDMLRVDENATCTPGPISQVIVSTSKMNSWNTVANTVPFTVRQNSFVTSEFLSLNLDVSDSPFSGLAEFVVGAHARLRVWRDVNLNGVFDVAVDQVVFSQATAGLGGTQDDFVGPQSDVQPRQTFAVSPGRYYAVFEVDHVFDTKLVGNIADTDDKFDTLGDACTAAAHLTIAVLSTGGSTPTSTGSVLGN